ncbi:MAG: anthranilate phosphoribosyltransferase, partial [Myxococcales bacterium]|nr:anthranilate phosphoribosyltransferase [Myxococcales bacterium]
VVHGADGMDEVSPTGGTELAIWDGDRIVEEVVTPEAFGLHHHSPSELVGGGPETNAQAMRDVLEGNGVAAFRDALILNAALALRVAGRVATWEEGLARADDSITSGAALHALHEYISASQALAAPPE